MGLIIMVNLMFTVFAFVTLLGALVAVLSRNTVNAAMALLVCLGGVAGLFLQLDAFLLAFLLILVYAGAVVALFLFIIMLLDVKGNLGGINRSIGTFASVAAVAVISLGVFVFLKKAELPTPEPSSVSMVGNTLKSYAELLFTTYLLPVEVISFLLLAAMLGVIALSRKTT
jgi:NADH-quinone oxidoreductase subunit J